MVSTIWSQLDHRALQSCFCNYATASTGGAAGRKLNSGNQRYEERQLHSQELAIDSMRFARLVREKRLLSQSFLATDADDVFTQHLPRGERRMDYR